MTCVILIAASVVGISLLPRTLYEAGTVILLGPQECKSSGFSLTYSSNLKGAFTTTNGTIVYIETVSQSSPSSAGTIIYSTGRVSSASLNVNLPASGSVHYYLEFCNHGSNATTSVMITASIVLSPHL